MKDIVNDGFEVIGNEEKKLNRGFILYVLTMTSFLICSILSLNFRSSVEAKHPAIFIVTFLLISIFSIYLYFNNKKFPTKRLITLGFVVTSLNLFLTIPFFYVSTIIFITFPIILPIILIFMKNKEYGKMLRTSFFLNIVVFSIYNIVFSLLINILKGSYDSNNTLVTILVIVLILGNILNAGSFLFTLFVYWRRSNTSDYILDQDNLYKGRLYLLSLTISGTLGFGAFLTTLILIPNLLRF